jgi:hypothetical protein
MNCRAITHDNPSELLTDPEMATVEEHEHCGMTESAAKGWEFGVGLPDLFEAGHSHSQTTFRMVVGEKGAFVELKR